MLKKMYSPYKYKYSPKEYKWQYITTEKESTFQYIKVDMRDNPHLSTSYTQMQTIH